MLLLQLQYKLIISHSSPAMLLLQLPRSSLIKSQRIPSYLTWQLHQEPEAPSPDGVENALDLITILSLPVLLLLQLPGAVNQEPDTLFKAAVATAWSSLINSQRIPSYLSWLLYSSMGVRRSKRLPSMLLLQLPGSNLISSQRLLPILLLQLIVN